MTTHTVKKSFYFEIFAVSLAAILIEITYTRIFSFKVYYYFTYLVIGVSLLGLGAGGVLVATSHRLRQADPARLIPTLCLIAGASLFGGYFIVALTQLNLFEITSEMIEIPKLVGICLVLTTPFLMTGIIISTILSRNPQRAGRLYGIDLLGAALGCAICIPLMRILDPPRTIILAGLIFSIAGLRRAKGRPLLAGLGGLLCAVSLLPLFVDGLLPDPVVGKDKQMFGQASEEEILFTKWDPVFRVDVTESLSNPGMEYILHHDGLPGSGLRRFDGDFSVVDFLDTDSRALPFEALPENPRVLIIGSAGGLEILASLYFGASHVTAVELNPVTVSLLTDTYADMTGRLHENPRVKIINGEGRWFIKQDQNKYDLIWFVAPDSYATMNAASSGAFVLSESYLFTVEMVRECLKHLTDQGIICTMFGEFNYADKPNRTTRYLSTARRAFSDSGVQEFDRHAMVATATAWPFSLSTIVLGKSPFTQDQAVGFKQMARKMEGGRARYFPGKTKANSPVHKIILLPATQLEEFYSTYKYEIHPVYDDSPYFWHFSRFRDAMSTPFKIGNAIVDHTDSIGEQVSLLLLILAIFLASLFLLSPLLAIRSTWKKIPYKLRSGTYFASLGLGFMFFEVSLIQMLTLFLGYPTYSLSVTLFGMLLFSGIGSLLSERYKAGRNRVLGILIVVLVGLVVFYQIGLPIIISMFIGHPLWVRISLTIVLIAPLGICLGTFMPIGLRTVANVTDHRQEYVAWAWAVNGFFSVVASILSTILAMIVGFKLVLLFALMIYILGGLMIARLPEEE